jgi:hypothetical protein
VRDHYVIDQSLDELSGTSEHGQLLRLPRKKGTLNEEMKKRKLRWKAPASWPEDLPSLESKLVSKDLGNVRDILKALEDGSLECLHMRR